MQDDDLSVHAPSGRLALAAFLYGPRSALGVCVSGGTARWLLVCPSLACGRCMTKMHWLLMLPVDWTCSEQLGHVLDGSCVQAVSGKGFSVPCHYCEGHVMCVALLGVVDRECGVVGFVRAVGDGQEPVFFVPALHCLCGLAGGCLSDILDGVAWMLLRCFLWCR